MKKRNVAGLIVIALFVIGIAAALMQYKREQTALEQPEAGKEPETQKEMMSELCLMQLKMRISLQ